MTGKAVLCSTAGSTGFILTSVVGFLEIQFFIKCISFPVLLKYCKSNSDLQREGGNGPLNNLGCLFVEHRTFHSPLPEHSTRLLTDVCPLQGIPVITHPWCQGKYAYFQCQDADTSSASAFLLQIKEHFSSWYFLFAGVQEGGEEMRQEGWSVCPEPALSLQMSVATFNEGKWCNHQRIPSL